MKIICQKPFYEKFCEALDDAYREGKLIEKVIITEDELNQLVPVLKNISFLSESDIRSAKSFELMGVLVEVE